MPWVPAPDLREAKPDWRRVPRGAIERLESWLGTGIVHADIAWGGYGPGASFALTLADGSRRFVKAMHPEQTPEGNAMLAREVAARIQYRFLDRIAPLLLGIIPCDGWEWVVFEYAEDCTPALPWTEAKLDALFAALGILHAESANLPVQHPTEDQFADTLPIDHDGWHAIAEDAESRAAFVSAFDDGESAARWLDRSLPVLRPLQRARREIAGPKGLNHFDLRSDNLLFRPDGRALLLDWSDLRFGPLAIELCAFAPSCIGEGGADGAKLRARFEAGVGIALFDRDVALALANVAGFFATRVGRPWRPAMPRLRWVVRQQFWGAMNWCETVLDLPPLPSLRVDDLAGP